MIRRIFLLVICAFVTSSAIVAQNSDSVKMKLPNVTVKTLGGKSISSSEISNNGKPLLLVFWKSCCSPNIKMLDAISEVYSDWKEETGVVLYAVSIDDSRSSSGIGPLVNGKGWEFKVLLDINSDFKRAMNVNGTPHIFVLNGNNEVVWQKTTYSPGDENEIYKILKTLKK
jgi:cytochrome c biogenesis protein CcmG, thiol:disulfide interchange protein DsbE